MKPIDHAAIYRDGRHYDLENRDIVADIPFYLRQAQRHGGPVLELACGTGRLTLPLAQAGFAITGVDISEGMLAQARAKAAALGVHVDWIHADVRQFSLGRRFRFIFFPFNSIAHLHDPESLEACFRCVREHLAPDGRFLVDMFNPSLGILTRDPTWRYPVTEYPDPDGRGTVVITENNVYDRAAQINYVRWYFSIGEAPDAEVQELNMRIFYPQELDALLHYNGFVTEAKYGDFDESPFASDSPKQLAVCRAS